jgi:hypothetical protein
MTIQTFLADLLAPQDLTPEQERILHQHKDEVTKHIRAKFGNGPIIKYAGSYEKGTLICDSYDLDIVSYFPSSDGRSLKAIWTDMSKWLQEKYAVEEKASAVRILDIKSTSSSPTPSAYHIDVVPGRFIDSSKDVFLYVSYGDRERMQTNLKTHIQHIAGSGCIEAIRLTKIWNHRNAIGLKTFVLELFVVESLRGFSDKHDPKASFLKVLTAFRDDFESGQLIDPANSNNIVSKLLHPSIRGLVASQAANSLALVSRADTPSTWQQVFKETPQRIVTPIVAPAVIRNPAPPWAH